MKTSKELILMLRALIYQTYPSNLSQIDQMRDLEVNIHRSCKTYLTLGVLIGVILSLLIHTTL